LVAVITVAAAGGRRLPVLLTADQHRRLAEIFEEAAADQSHKPEDRELLAQKAARFRMLARVAEKKAEARRLN
jgi:predicted outer membrane protein